MIRSVSHGNVCFYITLPHENKKFNLNLNLRNSYEIQLDFIRRFNVSWNELIKKIYIYKKKKKNIYINK